jgi:hypothetical protein
MIYVPPNVAILLQYVTQALDKKLKKNYRHRLLQPQAEFVGGGGEML